MTLYLECMARQSEFTIEDINVFYNVLSLFFVTSEELNQEEEFKDADYLRPKGSAKKRGKLYVLNGFMEFQAFN